MKLGEQLPLFTIMNRDKSEVRSDSFMGKNLVVYFYPKDETKVCTAQACAFRDQYEDFKDNNCEVIGISSDSEKSHEQFIANHQLPFLLVSDPKQVIRKLFGVPKDIFGLIPGRYTYVFNPKGILVHIFHSTFNAQAHITEALKAL